MSKKQKIGLLGGTFDPVHLGHLKIAKSVLTELELEKVYFIPAHKHAIKSNEKISPPETRLKLLQIALKKFPFFTVSDFELQNDNISFTIDTLKKIREYEKLPNAELYYIIGYDNLNELHLWKDYKKIMDMVQIVVVGRVGKYNDEFIKPFKDKFIFPDIPQIDISSTKIRKRIAENKSWKSMVPNEVHQYIIINNLYK